jgi:hypothetical protein
MMTPTRRYLTGIVACCGAVSLSGCVIQGGSAEHALATLVGMEAGRDYILQGGPENSYIDLPRVGFGTVVSGSLEEFLLQSDEEIERTGFRARIQYRYTDDTFFYGSFRRAEGDASASGMVAEGGSTDHGLTYLEPHVTGSGSGSSSSTGLFLGNSYGLMGEIRTDNTWNALNLGFGRVRRVGTNSAWKGRGSLYFEDIEQRHSSDVYATIGGVATGDIYQMTQVKLYDQYYGAELELEYIRTLPALGKSYFRLGAFADVASRNGNGRVDQQNMCGLCGSTSPAFQVNQGLSQDDDGMTLSGGLRASYGYQIAPGFNIEAGYERSYLSDVTAIQLPANPNEQPTTFTTETVPRHFFSLTLRGSF